MTTRQTGTKLQAQPGDILVVVRTFVQVGNIRNLPLTHPIDEFVARSPDELSLAKGDRIKLIERDDDFGDGWFLGQHLQNAQTGLFPEGQYIRWQQESNSEKAVEDALTNII